MDVVPLLPWIYGILLVVVHYWGEEIAGHPFRQRLTGLSAGVTVSYVFLELLPRFHGGMEHFGSWGFFSLLAGFSLPHLAESFIVQHRKSVDEVRKEFQEIHTFFVFTYYALIGVLIHFLLQQSVVAGTLLFIPVLLHTAISSLSLAELHSDVMENRVVKAAIMLSVLLGIGTASVIPLREAAAHLLLGLVTGMFLYVVISDSISQKNTGDVRVLAAGLLIYSGVIVYLWQLL